MANDPLNPSEGNPLERSPNSQPDMDREQAEANRKQEEAEQLNQAYKELGVQPKGDFNPDPPIEVGIQNASNKFEERREKNRASEEARIKGMERIAGRPDPKAIKAAEAANRDLAKNSGIDMNKNEEGIDIIARGEEQEAISATNERGGQLEQGRQNRARAAKVAENKADASVGFDTTAEGYGAAAESRQIAKEQLSKTVAEERERQRRLANESTTNMGINMTEGADQGISLNGLGNQIEAKQKRADEADATEKQRIAEDAKKEQMNARRREIANERLEGSNSTPDSVGSIIASVEQERVNRETQRKLANESRVNMGINLTKGAEEGISLTGLGNQIESKQRDEVDARGAEIETARQRRARAEQVRQNKLAAEQGFDETVGGIVLNQKQEKSARGQIESVANRLKTKANEARSAEHVARKTKKDAAFGEALKEVDEKAMYAQIAQREKDRQRRASTGAKNEELTTARAEEMDRVLAEDEANDKAQEALKKEADEKAMYAQIAQREKDRQRRASTSAMNEERINNEADRMTEVLAQDEANDQFQQNIANGLEAKAQEKLMNDEGAAEANRLVQEGLASDTAAVEAAKQAQAEKDQQGMDERFAGLRASEGQNLEDKNRRDVESLAAHNILQEQLAAEQEQKVAESERLATQKKSDNEEFLQGLSPRINGVQPKETGPVLSHEEIAGWTKEFDDKKSAEAARQAAQQGKSFARRAGEFVGRIGRFFGGGVKAEQAKILERSKASSPELDNYLNGISGQGAVENPGVESVQEAPAEAIILPDESVVEAPVVAETMPVPPRKEVAPVAEEPVETTPNIEEPKEEEVYDLKEEDMIKEPEVAAEVTPEQPAEKKLVKAERLPKKEKVETEKKLGNAEKLSLLKKLKEKWDEARRVDKEIKRISKILSEAATSKKAGETPLFGDKVKKDYEEQVDEFRKEKRKLSKEIINIAQELSGRNLRQEADEYTKVEIDGEELSKDEKYKLYNDSLVTDIQDLFEDEVNKLRKAEGKEAIKSNKKPLVRATAILGSKAGNKNQLRIAPKQLPIAKALSKGALSVNLPRPRTQRVIEVPETNLQNAG